VDFYAIIYRSWYYFRIGYGIYLTFPLGYIGFLALIYAYVVVPLNLNLGLLTSNVLIFEAAVAIFMTPAGIILGYLHLKHTKAWTAEIEVGVEANPYNYKVTPGKEREAYAPITLVTLQLMRKIAEKDNVLTTEEKQQLDVLESKMNTLLQGKYIVKPKRRN
jgi:hypothetical protein